MMTDLIEKINKMKSQRNIFHNYIKDIHFPHFKNIKNGSYINFQFPLTVLTGINGSGKSSCLAALYGAPANYSTEKFWFSTAVDPIEQEINTPNCFFYTYFLENEDNYLEVLKTMIKGNSRSKDYWETSRPILKYGMQRLDDPKKFRNKPVEKEVIYFDFRMELSAFDEYFNFLPLNQTPKLISKQDRLRKYSKYVKRAIDDNGIIQMRKRTNHLPELLNSEELKNISEILDKKYESCTILRHNFYDIEGNTVLFKQQQLNYSEAFAGRGEYSIAMLVHKIMNAPENSLVLMDEPESSLHPKAQKKLMSFLLNQIIKKKLQIIISTHAPSFIDGLPDEAIKLFYQNENGCFSIMDNCNYYYAFEIIGYSEIKKNTIMVEDKMAKNIIEAVIDNENDLKNIFSVEFFPGGASGLFKRAVTSCEEKETGLFFILDGDQKTGEKNIDITTLRNDELNIENLSSIIYTQTNINVNKLGFRLNGSKDLEKQKINSYKSFISYMYSNIYYLPLTNPEEIIWNEEYANNTLGKNNLNHISFSGSAKSKLVQFNRSYFKDEDLKFYEASVQLFVNNFINIKNNEYVSITNMLKKIKSIIIKLK